MLKLWDYFLHGDDIGRRLFFGLAGAGAVCSAAVSASDAGWAVLSEAYVVIPAIVAFITGIGSKKNGGT
jgi:hypothetical protein